MAINEVLDRGINVAVTRRLGLFDSSLSLLPELGINMVLPSEELLFHMGWRRYQRSILVAAVAAQFGQARILNPVASNIITIVEGLLVNTPGGAGSSLVELGLSNPGATSLATTQTGAIPRDSRQFPDGVTPAGTTCITSSTTAGGALTTGGLKFRTSANLGNLNMIPGAPWILSPGCALTLGDQTVNENLEVTFFWRERILNDQENAP